MVRWRIGFALAVLVAGGASAIACTDDPSSGGTAPPGIDGGEGGVADDGGVPPDGSATAFCDGTFGVVKRALEACCTATDQTTNDYHIVHGLLEALQPVCTSTLDASIAKGRVAFHADQASLCHAAYAATYAPGQCANITQTYSSPAGAACGLVFSGTGAEGGACSADHECNDGMTCVGYTKTTDGACHAPGVVGAPCGAQRVDAGGSVTFDLDLGFGAHPACAPGARCSSGSSTCVTAAAAGETCVDDEDCASPLLCHLHTCGTAGPAPAGAACKANDDCVKGLICDRPSNADGTCAAKRPAGGSCIAPAFGNVSACIGRCDADAGAAGSCASFCGSL